MDLEVVFAELGQFGRFQSWQYAILTIPLIATAFEEMSYIFTSSEVDYRCLIPECESPNTTEFLPPWLPNAVPFEEDPPEPKWCERYAVRPDAQNCSADAFLTNVTISCDHWVFDTKERTSATEFKLLCEDNVFKRTMVGTVNNLGLITNYVIICYLSDRFGRRTMLLILTFMQGLLVLAQSFSPTYITFISLEYLVCFCSTFNTSFVLALEIVGGDKRIFANCLMNTLYSLGEVIVALIMWWVQDFRVLLRVIATIKLVNLLYLWMVTESPHWYMTKEYYEKVSKIVNKIAQVNKRDISESTRHSINVLLAREEKQAKHSDVKPPTRSVIRELFKSPSLLIRFVICSLTWFVIIFTTKSYFKTRICCSFALETVLLVRLVNVFVYFGFSLMSVTLAGNKYFNFILMALVEIPAYAIMWIGMEFWNIGRKTTLVSMFFLAAVPCFIYLFVPTDAAATRLSLFLLGKFAITISYTVIYEVGAEVFPTELRQSMVGLCCAVACLGGLFAPQIPLMAMYMNPMMLFFWLSVGAGCLSLMLPETQGRSLPDTILQAIKLA